MADTNLDLLLSELHAGLAGLDARLDRLESEFREMRLECRDLRRASEKVNDKIDAFVLEVLDLKRRVKLDAD
jgi:predicted  nucleic acid-binding Zn-ribbon protein